MDRIYLKVTGDGTAFNPKRAWLVLGDHPIDEEGNHLLSSDCGGAWEVEENANRLKKLLDKAVAKAKRKFPE